MLIIMPVWVHSAGQCITDMPLWEHKKLLGSCFLQRKRMTLYGASVSPSFTKGKYNGGKMVVVMGGGFREG